MRTIKFKTLTLANFKSFADEQTLQLEGTPGLILVTGQNNVDPRLVGNGVGKSSLFDAVCFALYGKAADGSRGPDLVNWISKNFSVCILKFSIGKDAHVIERRIKPNILLLNGIEVAQDAIDKLVGISFELFNVTVLHGQSLAAFVDLPAALQLEYFTSLLSLDVYTAAGKIASKGAADIEVKIDKLAKIVTYSQGAMLELTNRIDALQVKEVEFLRKRLNIVLDLQRELKSLDKQIATVEKLPDVVDNVSTQHYDAAVRMEAKDRKYLGELQRDLEFATADLKRVQKAYPHAGICTECGQKLPDIAEARQKNKKKQERFKTEIEELNVQIERAENVLTASERNLKKQKNKLDKDRDGQDRFLRSKSSDLARLKYMKKAQQAEIERWLVPLSNPHTLEIQQTETRILKLREDITDASSHMDVLKRRAASLEFWEKGFKDLRLHIIDHALAQMTFRSNAALHDLGLPDWQISVQAESLNKSGTVRRGMRILAGKDGMTPLGVFSGGEKQRIRLAVALGFSDLVQSIVGVRTNCEFFDEPSSWLSQRGVTDLLDVLQERALIDGKRVFIADHRSLDYAFAETVTVVKSATGSTLEVL